MYKKQASKITGGLSAPGKMPEGSYNLPAAACQTGQLLAQVEGTPCSGCYALKGRYRFSNVKDALARRLDSLKHPDWVKAMTVLITGIKHFRWHDSGDLQSAWHLQQIFRVCEATPETSHWLPTQERKYLPLKGSTIPPNLIIRMSGHMIDRAAPTFWPWTSTVSTKTKTCPAQDQGNQCKDCRACWDRKVPNVVYPKH